MKKTAKITILLVCSCLLLSSCGEKYTEASSGYSITENQFVDYTFEYPEDWEVVRNDGMIAIKPENADVSLSCTIFEPDDPSMLVNEYWDGYFRTYKETFGDKVEVVSEEETVLHDVPAKDITYKSEIVGENFTFNQIVAVRNGTVYTLTYTAKPEDFDTYKSALTHAITSFRFKE